MSRLARASSRNTNNTSSTTNNTPVPSNNLSTAAATRPTTRTRTVSTQSAAPTRPPSRLNQIQASTATSSSSRTTITRKKSSPARLTNQNDLRRTTTESGNQEELQPTQGPLPGANIKVVVRCRGLTDSERAADPQAVLLTGGVRGRELTVDLNSHPSSAAPSDQPHARAHDIHSNRDEGAGLATTDYSSSLVDDPKRSANIKVYPFDHVFGPEADQALIFTDVVAPILTEVLQGYNCTIFAYGQTGTGKTYTMTGDLSIPTATTIMPTTKADSGPTSPLGQNYDSTPLVIPTSLRKFTNEAGIIPRVLHSLFNMLEDCSEEEKVEFGVKVSFVELYNEELRDLNYLESSNNLEANNPPSGSTNLKIFEDSNTKKGATGGSGVYIQNLTETAISSATEGIKILTLGSSRRQIAATKCNEQSSRSHSVFSITIHVKENNKDGKEDQLKIGKLNLVDLAGSENVGRSGAGKEFGRAREAGMINQSLLTLGRVINALVEKNSHVPYRESKLTRLLQDSLGGRTKTCIIATVSPSRLNLDETISTLDYALRAKSIKNRPELNNKINKSILINQYVHEIEKLRHDLIATRTKNGIYFSEERWAELMRDSENKSRTLIESKRKIELIELELIGVKKEFEKCLRILNVRESEIKKIQDELNLKSTDFENMKQIKEGLEIDLSEEKKMKEKFEKSRTKWKNQCKEVYEDNEGLREKIARKAAVESYNQNTLNEVDQSLSSSAANLKNDLKEFANQSNHINKGVKSYLNDMEQRLVKSMKSNQNLINNQIEVDLKQIISNITESMGEINTQLVESFVKEICEDLVPNGLVKQNQTHLTSIIQKLELDKFSNIQSILDQVKTDAFKFLQSTKESVQSSFEIIHQKFDQDREKIEKFHELEKAELKEEAARLKEEIERLRQHNLEEEKRIQQDEKELIDLIQRQHASNLKRKMTQTDSLVQSLAELKDRKDRKRLKFSGFEKELDEDRAQLDLQLNDTLGSANEQLEVFETTFQEGQASLLDNLTVDQRERINAYTAHSSKMENLGHTLDQNCGEFVKEFRKLDDGLQSEVAKIENQVVGVYHHKLVSQIKEQVQTVEGSVKHVLNDVERQATMSNDCIDKSLEMVSGLRNNIHLYLTNEIRQDVKTGQTPRRKKLPIEANPLLEQSSTSRFISLEDDSGDSGRSSADEGQEEEEQELEEDDEEYDDDDRGIGGSDVVGSDNHRSSSVATRSSRRVKDRPENQLLHSEKAESQDEEEGKNHHHPQNHLVESRHHHHQQQPSACLALEDAEDHQPDLVVKNPKRTSLKRKNQFSALPTPKSRSAGILREKSNQAVR
ncbi:Kinesin- protein 11 [Puccinia graminis f. sp. tritici]|uniref:Kinesin-protein 11 n=1 Tax=Puccinia graminis f. sp. tritici TaxID=56615 RepID=A0A5B0S077_PUCGR|nr:Kinesin- protein 11 [Puccinia graminis f. sp. tritici]KAA1131521.1 Kinesin- protein 11 [Puccinia graminis f. sp. tritici]